MELLQSFTYFVIGECSNPANQIATILSYIHISFQPFFINSLCIHFSPPNLRNKISFFAYPFCFLCVIVHILELYPFEWSEPCSQVVLFDLCGKYLCSVYGDWHISWHIPLNSISIKSFLFPETISKIPVISLIFNPYIIAAIIVPILYGSWRFCLYHIILGPVTSMILSSSPNERPAIWCLISIGIVGILLHTKLRNLMYSQSWNYFKNKKNNKPQIKR